MELTPALRYLLDRKVKVAIALILLVAVGLRLYGINWDQGYGFHPDERSIYMQSDCMYRILSNSQNYQDCNILKDFPDIEPGFPSPKVFFDSDRSPFNPHWFPLGSILIYLLVLIRFLLEPFLELNTFDMRFVGRSLSALADVSSIYLLFLLGRRLFNQRVGLLAATLMAITVIHIQMSHFYRPETFIVLFVLASFWFMLNVLEQNKLKDWIFLGVFVGLTFATKVSVLPVFIPLLILAAFSLFGCSNDSDAVPRSSKAYRLIRHAIIGGVVAVSVFFILTPYAFIDLPKFVIDTTWEASVAREAGKMPYTVQYIGTTSFIYELKQSSIWALGVPLGIVAWCGLLYTIYCTIRRKDNWKGNLLLLGWVLPNFLLIGGFFEVKFLRYIFPIIPFLILFGSRWLVILLDGVKTWHSTVNATTATLKPLQHLKAYGPVLARGVIGVVIVTSFLYTLGFMGVYSRPHPAVAASDWINQNVARGSTIITDNHWDEGIPGIYSYDVRQIPIYEGETRENMKRIARDLSQAQYLIFYSNRTYGSIARLPERYPYSSRYYHLLFSGDLGYKFDRAFTSYPKLLGVALKNDTFSRATLPEPEELKATKPAALTLNMGFADENVMNYDHPAVLLFKNVESLQQEQIFKALTPDSLEISTKVPLKLMLTTEELDMQRQGGTWSDIVKTDSWSNKVPILAWILVVELIYLASVPLAFFVFRPLPDRGMIVARVLGILGVSYVAWLLASLHLLSFSRISMWVGLLILTSLSLLVLLQSWRELLGFLRRSWRFLAVGEALFLGAFLTFVILRMANPDLWEPWLGGEKPMDFAYLNAILRSSYMPPFDPWFSGGYLNYYYWGQFIIANLIKATGILPSVAYNLAVPLLFALTVTSAFSIVYNVSEGLSKTWRVPGNPRETDGRRIAMTLTWLKTPVAAGLLAALFVAVIANLDGAIQLVQLGWNGVVRGGIFDNFDFWRSSRMLPPLADLKPSFLTFWLPDRLVLPPNFCFTQLRLDNTCPDISHHITEFPFFSFLFGDLHAHVIAIPFTLLTLSLGLAFLVGLRHATREWIIAVVPILAVALGSLWVINSWDYPAYLLLTLAMFAVGAYLMVGENGHTRRVRTFIGITIPTILLSVLAFLPFHLRYETFGALIGISKWQTPFVNYLGIHGLFVFLILTFFIYLNRFRLKRVLLRPIRSHPPAKNGNKHRGREKIKVTWEAAAILVSMVLIICLAAAGYWTAAFLLALIVLGASAVHEEFSKLNDGSGFMLFPIIIAGFAFLIAIGVEFLRVGNDIGRINTLFKFYLDAWVLLSLAGAISMWYLARQGLFSFGNLPNSRRLILWVLTIIITVLILDFVFWIAVRVDWSRTSYHIARLDTLDQYSTVAVILSVGLVLLLIPVLTARGAFYFKNMLLAKAFMIILLASLVFSSLIYTVLGTRARLSNRFDTQDMTLNGEAFMSRAVHMEQDTAFELKWDYDAILWLRNNVQGSPVVMEAHTEQYRWGGRIATYTGLPTVLGWPWHQIQQRGDYFAILQRASSVEETYSTVDPYRALEIFDAYAVKYVVVGELERIFYPQSGIAKFQYMVDEGLLSVAYRNLGTTIYEVGPNDD